MEEKGRRMEEQERATEWSKVEEGGRKKIGGKGEENERKEG